MRAVADAPTGQIVYRLIEHLENVELEVSGIKASATTAAAAVDSGAAAAGGASSIAAARRSASADDGDRDCVRAIARGERLLHVSPEVFDAILSRNARA